MVKVKLCGVTCLEDALMAAALGVNALGFIFAPSPRRVDPEKARGIILSLPPFIQSVGVFVDEDLRVIRRIVDFCGLDLVQLHGGEPPGLCSALMPRCIKALQVMDRGSLAGFRRYEGRVRALLLDTGSGTRRGGTGVPFDWGLLEGETISHPLILAGGLDAGNIGAAIRAVRPYGVDVNSGVEIRPGRKDPVRLEGFMRALEAFQMEGYEEA